MRFLKVLYVCMYVCAHERSVRIQDPLAQTTVQIPESVLCMYVCMYVCAHERSCQDSAPSRMNDGTNS